MSVNFPKDFLFGSAISAYQAEGATETDGKGKVYWDQYLKRPESKFNGDTASNFYHTFASDLKRAALINQNAIRISISWARIFPDSSLVPNKTGIQYYKNLFQECFNNKIQPFVTLHHFDTPLWIFEKGDWLYQDMPNLFAEFSRFCFETFSNIRNWITINEPWSLANGQHIVGHFPPNNKFEIRKAVQSLISMAVSHCLAVKIFKQGKFAGKIGIVNILEPKIAFTKNREDIDAAIRWNDLCNSLIMDMTVKGSFSDSTVNSLSYILGHDFLDLISEDYLNTIKNWADKTDFLGVNYYTSHFVKNYSGKSEIVHNGTGKKGSGKYALERVGQAVDNPHIQKTDWDWAIYPQGISQILKWVKNKYSASLEIYITENGLGLIENLDKNNMIEDKLRIEYQHDHLLEITKTIESGVNIKGYFAWSLFDVLSWTNGFNKRYGYFFIDFSNQRRYLKRSGAWIANVAKNNHLVIDISDEEYKKISEEVNNVSQR